ncbi:uncharacterized protein LOC110107117 isoform X2 [Dendrobium catenatum]|uniref:uncharacterized protein LOC110107117 isoform X2 n=1 Tax=Dendrobium catenatum TaxID=906689 RepID=UPI0009F41FC4|nr:uncharacterized protein LOC110107117 isoform X2 [Dendrobium catenatum]
MPCLSLPLGLQIRAWLRDYDRIQSISVFLIYIQIGCSLLGSLGALFNGVLLINLVIALFALVAIESSSQNLGRTYAVLLFCAILLDVAWFILFSHTIWNFGLEKYGPSFIFSVRLAFSMQIIGFSVRFLSSFLWIQMYRLGATTVANLGYQEIDFHATNDYIYPASNAIARQDSNSSDILGGSIYDPAYYSSLFEDAQDNCIQEGGKKIIGQDWGSTSSTGSPQLKSCISRSFQTYVGS